MAPGLVAQAQANEIKKGSSLWIKKGTLPANSSITFFVLKSSIRDYCGVSVISSNVRLYPVLAGFFPTTVNVKK